jgi:hypothetical protein
MAARVGWRTTLLFLRGQLIAIACEIVLVFILGIFFHISFGLMALAVLIGFPLAGLLITIDEEFPGGWNGKQPFFFRTPLWWGQMLLQTAPVFAIWTLQSWPNICVTGPLLLTSLGAVYIGFNIIRKTLGVP